jgi:hypothetical protein
MANDRDRFASRSDKKYARAVAFSSSLKPGA